MGCGPSSDKPTTKMTIKDKEEHSSLQKNNNSPMNSTDPQRKHSEREMPEVLSQYKGIRDKYKLLDLLGSGRYGVVYKAESTFDPKNKFAIKILKIVNPAEKKKVLDEIRILKNLDHPNILKYYEEIEDGPYIFLVTELCSGGELLDHIADKSVFNESEAAAITEKLLKAISHFHSKNIAHRDIKPENILYTSKDPDAEIKIIDFGFAKAAAKQEYQTMIGSPIFIAPEVIEGNYTKACDIWSIGVVLHIMLSGFAPYRGNTVYEVLQNIQTQKLSFEGGEWEKVTPPAKEVLKALLNIDENLRPSATEALKFLWFKQVKLYPPEIDELDKNILISLNRYKGTSKLQKSIMNIVVKTLKEEEISNLIEAYRALDQDSTGYISFDELVKVFKKEFPGVDLKTIIGEMDAHGCGKINYTQFIAATIDYKKFLTHERLWALFQYFDVNHTDSLTAENILEVFNYSAVKDFELSEIHQMLREHGVKGSDGISFKKFTEIMQKMNFSPEEDDVRNLFNKNKS